MHDPPGDVGLGQVHGVATTRNERDQARGKKLHHALCMHGESSVVGARHCQHREVEGWQSIPQWLLGARTGEPQAGGQALSRVATAFGAVGRWAESGEHRGLHPSLDERVDVATFLEWGGQRFVGRSSLGPGFGVIDAAGGTNKYHRIESELGPESDVQGDSSTEGVAEQRSRLRTHCVRHRLGYQFGRGGEIRPDFVRSSVTGEVNGDQGEVVGQAVAEGTPQSPGLRKAVQQGEGRSRAADLDMEWHVG